MGAASTAERVTMAVAVPTLSRALGATQKTVLAVWAE
jgi:hypothetical protein